MNKKGFTLVELLVAVFIFLAAVTAFHYLLISAAQTLDSATALQAGVLAIRSQMEELHATSFYNLTAYNGLTFAHGLGKISVAAVMADLIKIDLVLTWHPDKAPLKLATLRSKY